MKVIFFFISILVFSIHLSARDLDPSFLAPPEGTDQSIKSIAVQPDGKIIIVGHFQSYGNIPVGRIARLTPNGQLDTSFDTGTGADLMIEACAVQPDGKILIAGSFSSFNGVPTPNILRLNNDGSMDTTFDAGTGTDLFITSITIQPDGKIIIAGSFSIFNGIPHNSIARLNYNGSLDPLFDIGTGANDYINNSTLLSDGKILIVGNFSSYNNTERNKIARLHSDGRLDDTFDPGVGANQTINCAKVSADQKILIGGNFTSYQGQALSRIARLHPDGTLDESFQGIPGSDNYINNILFQSNGKIILIGFFEYIHGISQNRIARLNEDGSLDTHFNRKAGANNTIHSAVVLEDDKILIGGSFSSFNNIPLRGIAKLQKGCETDSITQHITLCQGQSYTFNNHIYTNAGTYRDTLVASTKCDSIVITILKVNPTHIQTNNPPPICKGASYSVGTHTYTEPGKYTDTFQNIYGCDSLVVTTLIVIPDTITKSVSICEGQGYTIGDSNYTVPGKYAETISMNEAPYCTVTVFTDLSINPPDIIQNPQAICSGDFYKFNGKNYNIPGVYFDTLIDQSCQYIFVTELTVNEKPEIYIEQNDATLTVSEIPGASYQWITCEQNYELIEDETSHVFTATSNGTFAAIIKTGNCIDTSACYSIVSTRLPNTWDRLHFSLYPNPATDVLHLTVSPNNNASQIKIMNLTGQLMLSTTTLPISVSMLPKGLYILAVETPQGIWHEQFVKE
jgi:uncharacterized delta-60 repeat protein